MHTRFPAVGGILLAALLLAGCGQNGPLYLPGNPGDVRMEVPTQDAAPGNTDDDADGDRQNDDDSN